MENLENRRHPRTSICEQQRVLHLSQQNQVMGYPVLSKDVSVAGLCFRSPLYLKKGDLFLISLKSVLMEEVRNNQLGLVKLGSYLLGRAVWNSYSIVLDKPAYHIGCSFLKRSDASREVVDLFIHLINHDVAGTMSP